MKRLGFLIFILFFSLKSFSATPRFQIVPDKSSLGFVATQNDSPVSGQFKKFQGTIQFDPQQLATSMVNIIVDMNSVNASYDQVADTLKAAEWFNVKIFPQATFKASKFKKTGDKSYQAEGTLTMRDKTLPLTLDFTLDEFSKTAAHVTGSAMLKRNAFGVGQGEWAATDSIKDDVKINFVVTAKGLS